MPYSKATPFLLFFCLCLAQPWSAPANAAKIGIVQLNEFDNLNNGSIDVDSGIGHNTGSDGQIKCNFYLQGPVERDDFKKLKTFYNENKHALGSNTARLCLNSPGGNYVAGLRISAFLIDNGIGTAVPHGAECHSSCAFIFMGGSFPWKGQINRYLNAGGVLGFHAPYVDGLAKKQYDNKSVEGAYSDGIKAVRWMMALGVGNKVKRMTPELLAELLAKGPHEVYLIDTIGKAIRHRIHLYGLKDDLAPTQRTFCNACVNMNYGAQERYGWKAETDLCASPGEVRRRDFPKGRRLTYQVAPRLGTCTLDLALAGSKVARWTFIHEERDGWEDGLELAFWYLYPPNLLLHPLSNKPLRALGAPGRRDDSGVPKPKRDLIKAFRNFVFFAYLGHGRDNHVSSPGLFADKVQYYDQGYLTREQVDRDRQAYYRRWPQRRYELIKGSIKAKATGGDRVDVSFRYRFRVASRAKVVAGVGISYLTVSVSNGTFLILSEAGRVLRRF